jgi:hypothetical protein
MTDIHDVAVVLDELIEALQVQVKELETLVTHVEQVSPRMGYTSQLPVVRAQLSALHLRVKQMRQPAG